MTSSLAVPRGPDRRLVELRGLLASRDAVDDREQRALEAFAQALDRLSAPFDQEADLTHVTSSAVVLGPRGVLLHRHRRLGIWLQPGGHLDPGEDLAAGAVREVREETGLFPIHPPEGPRLVHVDVHEGGRGHIHLDLRWQLWADGEPAPPAHESPDVRWFAWDEALVMADEGLVGALRALRPPA